MTRVKLKTDNPKDSSRKLKLLEILSSCEIYVVRIIPAADALIILTNSEKDLDKLFSGSTDLALEKENFSLNFHRN